MSEQTYNYQGNLTLEFEVDLEQEIDYETENGKRIILEAIYDYLDWSYFKEARLENVTNEVTNV